MGDDAEISLSVNDFEIWNQSMVNISYTKVLVVLAVVFWNMGKWGKRWDKLMMQYQLIFESSILIEKVNQQQMESNGFEGLKFVQ